MINLPQQLIEKYKSSPETGMGYCIADLHLKNGEIIRQAVLMEGMVTQAKGYKELNFTTNDIADFRVTHEKWNFN